MAIFVAALSSPAAAFSGAEFLKSERAFASGYAWGALAYRLSVGNEQDRERLGAVAECFRGAGVDSDTFYYAVRAYLEDNLSALTEPAIGAVLRTSLEMCPWD